MRFVYVQARGADLIEVEPPSLVSEWTTVVCSVNLCELCDGDLECGCFCHVARVPCGEERCGCTPTRECGEHAIAADDAYRRQVDR